MKSFSFVIIILLCCSKSLQFIGNKPTATESKFVVSIQWHIGHLCSGSIIAPDWVLTAAACIRSYASILLTIRYGVLNCSRLNTDMNTTRVVVRREVSGHHALALLKVDEAFSTRLVRSFARLPSSQPNLERGLHGLVYGWDGTLGDTADLLKYASFYVTTGSEHPHNHIVTDYEFEAEGIDTGITVGNVGSPFVSQYMVTGVVSPISTFSGSLPDIFYRVSHFFEWINSTTGGIIC